jgi:hypothetical protein
MASHLRVKANTTMNRKETTILVAKSCDRCLTCDRRLTGYFAAVFSNIILPTIASIIAPVSRIRVLGYEFEADQPLFDLFERDTRSPCARTFNKRARAIPNLFGALGSNHHLEEIINAYGRLHLFGPLLLSCLLISSGFITGVKLLFVIMRFS